MNEKSTHTTRTIGILAAVALIVAVSSGCDSGPGFGSSGFSKPGSSIGSKFKPKSGFGTSSKTKRR